MSTQQEFEVLRTIEDALQPAVVKAYDASYVGRITNCGRREFYFYSAGAAGVAAFAKRRMSKFPGYEFETEIHSDPGWTHYLDCMYPDGGSLQWMGDRRLVALLKEKGDRLEAERPVSHYTYLPSRDARKRFSGFLAGNGFGKLKNFNPKVAKKDTLRYGISCVKRQAVTLDDISSTTRLLDAEAEKLGGDYDGWETQVTDG